MGRGRTAELVLGLVGVPQRDTVAAVALAMIEPD